LVLAKDKVTQCSVIYHFTKTRSVSHQEDLLNPVQVHTADWYCGEPSPAGYTISPPDRTTTADPLQITTAHRIL